MVACSTTWNSKEERQKWENLFFDTFLAKVLNEPNKIVNEVARMLKAETRNEDDQSKKLYFMAYEMINEDPNAKRYLYENTEFWRYQPEVNFEMLVIELNNRTPPEEHRILKKFVEMVNFSKFHISVKMLNFVH